MPNRTSTNQPEKMFNFKDFNLDWIPPAPKDYARDSHGKSKVPTISTKPNIKRSLRKSYYGK